MFKLVKFTSNRSLEDAVATYQQRIEDSLQIYKRYKHQLVHRPCFICGSEAYAQQEPFHNTFSVVCCNHCHSLFVNPVPSTEALADYYNNSVCNRMLESIVRKRHHETKNFILDDRIRSIIEKVKDMNQSTVRILEVGCNNGSFLVKLNSALKENCPGQNFILEGIDIDQNAINNRVDDELALYCASAESFTRNASDGLYDFILHFELIEHLVNPHEFMIALQRLLKPDGYVIFTTPNAMGIEMLATSYNGRRLLAHSIFPPMHLNAFSTANIVHFGLRCGYQVKQISTPGKLDIDMICQNKDELTEPTFAHLTGLSEETLGLLQHIVSMANVSSHMQCIFKK